MMAQRRAHQTMRLLLLLPLMLRDTRAWTTTSIEHHAPTSIMRQPQDQLRRSQWIRQSATSLQAFTSQKEDFLQSRRQYTVSLTSGLLSLLLADPAFAAGGVVTTAATCDPTVSVWKRQNRLIYLLGTAHISEISARLASQLVKDVHPNAVFVELDLKRVGGRPPKSTEIVTTRLELPTSNGNSKVIVPKIAATSSSAQSLSSQTSDGSSMATSGSEASSTPVPGAAGTTQRGGGLGQRALGFGAAAVGNAIRGLYKNLDDQGLKAGQEFVAAIAAGQEIGADIVLGDRDVEVTLRRLTQALASTDLNALLNPNSEVEKSMQELLPTAPRTPQSASSFTNRDEISNYVEALKTRENVRRIMAQLNDVAPALVQVMLTERDVYMATGLDTLNDKRITCAVMGIAHQDGVERNLHDFGWQQVQLKCSVRK